MHVNGRADDDPVDDHGRKQPSHQSLCMLGGIVSALRRAGRLEDHLLRCMPRIPLELRWMMLTKDASFPLPNHGPININPR